MLCTQFGLYKYLFMIFGLCNAPAAFQALIKEVLFNLFDSLAVVYLDDTLIFFRIWIHGAFM